METNWLELWRELVEQNPLPKNSNMVQRFALQAKQNTERHDPLLDEVLAGVDKGDSVLDIGAGSGRWTLPLAEAAGRVTAIEPKDSMVAILKERIAASASTNIAVLQTRWEEAPVESHDIAVCSQAIYDSPDLERFVRKMEGLSRKKCFLAIRLPPADGIIAELSLAIHGRRFDSPDAMIAFNALYMLGIYPDVKVEREILHWSDSDLEEAVQRAKRHLRLGNNSLQDRLITATLERRLTQADGRLIWPDGMRSALLGWQPSHGGKD